MPPIGRTHHGVTHLEAKGSGLPILRYVGFCPELKSYIYFLCNPLFTPSMINLPEAFNPLFLFIYTISLRGSSSPTNCESKTSLGRGVKVPLLRTILTYLFRESECQQPKSSQCVEPTRDQEFFLRLSSRTVIALLPRYLSCNIDGVVTLLTTW